MAYWNDRTVIVTGGTGVLSSYVVKGLPAPSWSSRRPSQYRMAPKRRGRDAWS